MVVDSLALIAILENEPEAERMASAIARAETCFLSAASWIETTMVVEGRHGSVGGKALELLLCRSG